MNKISISDYLSDIKTSIASSMSVTIFSLSHLQDPQWYVIDSWAEVGVIVGITLSFLNFCVYLYDKFYRKSNKSDDTKK